MSVCLNPMQLEKVIGKVKTEKYGGRIIELMRSDVTDARAGNGADANKKSKKDKDVVFDSLWRVAAKNNIG